MCRSAVRPEKQLESNFKMVPMALAALLTVIGTHKPASTHAPTYRVAEMLAAVFFGSTIAFFKNRRKCWRLRKQKKGRGAESSDATRGLNGAHSQRRFGRGMGLVAELPPKLARGPAGRDDFGPRMGGTLSTQSTHSTLATGASISTLHGFKNTLNFSASNSE